VLLAEAGSLIRRFPALLLALVFSVVAGFTAPRADARILFAKGTDVPPRVQQFAWRVIEARCRSLSYGLDQRSFWAYDARGSRSDGALVHSIKILSEVTWKKTEPPAVIEMTVVDADGLRLTALNASLGACSP
jgi:hypothetical protein